MHSFVEIFYSTAFFPESIPELLRWSGRIAWGLSSNVTRPKSKQIARNSFCTLWFNYVRSEKFFHHLICVSKEFHGVQMYPTPASLHMVHVPRMAGATTVALRWVDAPSSSILAYEGATTKATYSWRMTCPGGPSNMECSGYIVWTYRTLHVRNILQKKHMQDTSAWRILGNRKIERDIWGYITKPLTCGGVI